MQTYQERFFASMQGESSTLQEAIKSISSSEGKHLRPALLLLTAKCLGKIDVSTIDAAIFIEMLHTATLIHDDVVDKTDQRRGSPALHTIIGNRAAVLVGDYLLSTSMFMAVQTAKLSILEVLMTLGQALSDGELYQLDMAKKDYPTEEKYYRIIEKKTGFLIASAMKIGVLMSENNDSSLPNTIFQAGLLLGKAFQIRDDVFDYLPATNGLGKPVGNDLREHKVTLPLIHALEGDDAEDYRKLLSKPTLKEEEIHRLILFARERGGIEYADEKIRKLLDEAIVLLENNLPENEARVALIKLCHYIGSRKK